MLKKVTYFILLILVFGCEEKTAKKTTTDDLIYKKPVTEEIVRPINLTFLEKENDSIKKYYEVLGNFEIWYHKTNRQDLINEIKLSYREGLLPEDYHYKKIKALEESRNQLSDEDIIRYDILLTRTFEKLANHLHAGKLNPKKLYQTTKLYTHTTFNHALQTYFKKKTQYSGFFYIFQKKDTI
jgi:hypothetical protein